MYERMNWMNVWMNEFIWTYKSAKDDAYSTQMGIPCQFSYTSCKWNDNF